MSRAEEIFQSILKGHSSRIHEFIHGNVTEELFLDYKNASTPSARSSLSDDDRKNAGKAISGFANSEGGVVIWGVDCRRDRSGKEIVKLNAIPDPAWFKSLLDGAVGGLTSPPHQSVESIAIGMTGGDGVVVTLIPEGLNVPYRSNASGTQGYFLRAGSSFEPVPHAVLAAMFGRRPAPRLIGRFRPLQPTSQGGELTVKVTFEIVVENLGRGIADDLFVIVRGKDAHGVLLRMKHSSHAHWFDYQFDDQRVFNTNASFHRLMPGAKLIVPYQFQFEIAHGAGPFRIEATCGSSHSAGDTFECNLSTDDCVKIHENLSFDFRLDSSTRTAAIETVRTRLEKACLSH